MLFRASPGQYHVTRRGRLRKFAVVTKCKYRLDITFAFCTRFQPVGLLANLFQRSQLNKLLLPLDERPNHWLAGRARCSAHPYHGVGATIPYHTMEYHGVLHTRTMEKVLPYHTIPWSTMANCSRLFLSYCTVAHCFLTFQRNTTCLVAT